MSDSMPTATPGGRSADYRGRWERLLLAAPGQPDDRGTRVIWLQSSLLYCDVRVPANRPDWSGARALADADDAALVWLTRQEGFAGHLEAERDLCWWHRHIDYAPAAPLGDAGHMTPRGGLVIETGVFANYLEEWRRTGTGGEADYAAKLYFSGLEGERPLRQGLLVAVDDDFMFARERGTPNARCADLMHRAFTLHEREAMLDVLDFEISWGRRRGGRLPWEIQLSTLPFLEGSSLLEPGMGSTPADPAPPLAARLTAGRTLTTVVYELGSAFDWGG